MKAALSLQPTDAWLMREVQAGERPALGELYDRFAPRAYRTALSVCHDHDCAQDAVQDAFLSMWSSRATYQPARGSVAAWAMSVVRHRALYLARRQTLAAHHDERETRLEEEPARDNVPSEFAARAEREQLTELLARLPAAQQQVIRLGFVDGLTHQEISRRLALPPGTIKGRMRLGLRKLRTGLEPLDTRPAPAPCTLNQAPQRRPNRPIIGDT
jgi:RNA polymerase sigma-70 factor (ECF subfamily)